MESRLRLYRRASGGLAQLTTGRGSWTDQGGKDECWYLNGNSDVVSFRLMGRNSIANGRLCRRQGIKLRPHTKSQKIPNGRNDKSKASNGDYVGEDGEAE